MMITGYGVHWTGEKINEMECLVDAFEFVHGAQLIELIILNSRIGRLILAFFFGDRKVSTLFFFLNGA